MKALLSKYKNYFTFFILLILLISIKVSNPSFVKSISFISFDLYQKIFPLEKNVIEDLITDEECQHFVNASNSKLERAKTIGGKDGIYHENRTGSNCWIAHNHSEVTTNLGQRISDLVGFLRKLPLRVFRCSIFFIRSITSWQVKETL